MVLSYPADHLSQQLPSKRLLSQTPTPPNPSVFPPILRPTSLLHPYLKLPPPSPTVPRDAVFPQQSVHPQPTRALARCLEVFRVTAPPKKGSVQTFDTKLAFCSGSSRHYFFPRRARDSKFDSIPILQSSRTSAGRKRRNEGCQRSQLWFYSPQDNARGGRRNSARQPKGTMI